MVLKKNNILNIMRSSNFGENQEEPLCYAWGVYSFCKTQGYFSSFSQFSSLKMIRGALHTGTN
jgi:hypothetical protein